MLTKSVMHVCRRVPGYSTLRRIFKKRPRGRSWQQKEEERTVAKFKVVRSILDDAGATSVLDIGCNAGMITRLLGESGFFAVGIDKNLDFSGVSDPLLGACIGKQELNMDTVKRLPLFGGVLILSVHHHWIREFGDEGARRLLKALAEKSDRVIVLEAASFNSNYRASKGSLFVDNDEGSVTAYVKDWLEGTLASCWSVEYVWKNVRPAEIGNRFTFACRRV